MDYRAISDADARAVGKKETMKALQEDRAQVVFAADDADWHVVRHIIELAEEKGIQVVKVDSMEELGTACGIDVGAAVASILNEDGPG